MHRSKYFIATILCLAVLCWTLPASASKGTRPQQNNNGRNKAQPKAYSKSDLQLQKVMAKVNNLLQRQGFYDFDSATLQLPPSQRKERLSSLIAGHPDKKLVRLDEAWLTQPSPPAIVLADTVLLPDKAELPGETLIFTNRVMLEQENCVLSIRGNAYLITNDGISTLSAKGGIPTIIVQRIRGGTDNSTNDRKIGYVPFDKGQNILAPNAWINKLSHDGGFNFAASPINLWSGLLAGKIGLLTTPGFSNELWKAKEVATNVASVSSPAVPGGGVAARRTLGMPAECGINDGKGDTGNAGTAGSPGDKGGDGNRGSDGFFGGSMYYDNGQNCDSFNVYLNAPGFNGTDGAPGQQGQQGGDGGPGGPGGSGADCACGQWGHGGGVGGTGGKGGDAGKGGNGGNGGDGGNGGSGGDLYVVATCCALSYGSYGNNSPGGYGGWGGFGGSPAPNGSPGAGGPGGQGGIGIGENCPNGNPGSSGGTGGTNVGFASPGANGVPGSSGYDGGTFVYCY